MQGAPRRSARSFFVLPLVLALLALVAFPVFANAAGGEIPQYEVEETESLPTQTTTKPKHQSSGHESSTPKKAHGSEASTGTPEEPESEETEESKGGVGTTGGNNGGGTGGNHSGGGPTSGNGGEGAKSGGGNNNGLSNQKEVAPATAKGKNASESSGGSSPVVPILIAVIVLAAISIGVVLYRQRKSGQGPDRRVSSSNAS